MADSSEHFRGGTWDQPQDGDGGGFGPHRHRPPDRLSLTPVERANLPPDALALVSPLLVRNPATWELSEVQAVTAALDRANGSEAAASLRSRLLSLGNPVVRAHEDQYRPLVDEVRRLNDEEVAARRRPTSGAYSRYRAQDRVDRMKREAGVAAMEEERRVWRANPDDPQATTAIRAARATAEREVELRRTQLEADEAAKIEADRINQNNVKSRQRASRKSALVKILRDAHVTVPAEPRELTS